MLEHDSCWESKFKRQVESEYIINTAIGVYYGRTKGMIVLVNDSRGSFYISRWDDVLGMDS